MKRKDGIMARMARNLKKDTEQQAKAEKKQEERVQLEKDAKRFGL